MVLCDKAKGLTVSRGTSWGMEGYMFLARNDNNMCGIANEGCYPVIKN
jgi:hypothetical protein